MKKLATVILNWNGLELLRTFLPAAAEYSISAQMDLFVADNGSTDQSVKWVRENYPQVRIIELDRNYGFAEGYNRAIAQLTDYEYAVLLNSDVEVTPMWWQPMMRLMDSDRKVGAVQPKIKSWHDRRKFEYAGAAGGYLDAWGYPYCRGRLFDSVEEDHGQYDGEPAEVCWASGACLMVRVADYLRLGGLDPQFFAHMEEIDLCCRMIAAGYKVMAVTDSAVYHVGGASLPQGNAKKTYLNFRNNLLLLHKNLPRKAGQRKLFVRRLADTLAWAMFLLKGDFANAGAVLRAHRDFRRMRRGYTEHPATNMLSKVPGANRHIVFDRYLLHKKK